MLNLRFQRQIRIGNETRLAVAFQQLTIFVLFTPSLFVNVVLVDGSTVVLDCIATVILDHTQNVYDELTNDIRNHVKCNVNVM